MKITHLISTVANYHLRTKKTKEAGQ